MVVFVLLVFFIVSFLVYIKLRREMVTYLSGKSFDENGDQQIEEDVVSKCHQSNKIERGPVTCLLHAIKQDHIPIFLS